MKTAISLPDEVFESAERLAQQLRMSRSELYVTALQAFLASHEEEHLTQAINQALHEAGNPGLDPVLAATQYHSLKEEW